MHALIGRREPQYIQVPWFHGFNTNRRCIAIQREPRTGPALTRSLIVLDVIGHKDGFTRRGFDP